jgi:dihydroxy-acid dehydratase
MGGISSGKAVLPLITGPMLAGSFRGQRIGACTDCRNNWAAYRGGEINVEEVSQLNEELAPSAGTCGVMGTASTMACVTAALGLIDLRGGATAAAVSSARLRIAEETGRNAVAAAASMSDGAATPLTLTNILSEASFHNAVTVLQAIGGSTNAVVHLLAIAKRHPEVAGKISLQTIDDIGRKTPLLVDLKPSGDNYMTDLHNAGGMLALLHTLRPLLRLEALTVTGQSLGELLDSAPFRPFPFSSQIIRPLDNPLHPSSSLCVLRGNLAPGGAVIKASASKYRHLLSHRGRAVVFAGPADLAARIDDPDLAVDENSVLVLQGIGPVGFLSPGMPEAGLVPIPRKLAQKGVKDMLRLSDGRMSGTAGGSIVLHISPEAALPESVLGIVRTGDYITCHVENRRLEVELSDQEIQARIADRRERLEGNKDSRGPADVKRKPARGYRGLYERHVNQAEEGVDFDFLTVDGAECSF